MNTNPVKPAKPAKRAKKRGPRDLCIGGCGRSVLSKLGAECRKCRRQRIHAGLKKIKKVERAGRKRLDKALDPIVDAYLNTPSAEPA